MHVLTEPVRVVDGEDAHKLVVFELHRVKVAISDDSIVTLVVQAVVSS